MSRAGSAQTPSCMRTSRSARSARQLNEDEARFVFEKGCEELILGTGQYGNAALSPEAAAF